MGTFPMGSRLSAPQTRGAITCFYTSDAWIDGRAEDQLNHVSTWSGVTKIAAFPDLHPGKYGPVGCAILSDRLYPQLVGTDIGCGMSLFQLDLPIRKLKLEKATRRLRVLGSPQDVPRHADLAQAGLPGDLWPEALGTIGGGNHFCEVQRSAEVSPHCDLDPDLTYLLVHSGSRGLGASIFDTYMSDLQAGMIGAEADGYRIAHDQAVRWASLNREIIARRAAAALRADLVQISDAPHNLVTETDAGWLHRKGAAVASGLVPLAGSRATPSYLMESLDQSAALGALAHGAGRRYDRSSMHGRVQGQKSNLERMTRTSFGGRVICEDRALMIEEAPEAYKSAAQVAQQLVTTQAAKVVATFHPVVTFKKIRGDR